MADEEGRSHGHDGRAGSPTRGSSSRLPAPPREAGAGIGLEGLPAAAVEEASWWEAHIAEVRLRAAAGRARRDAPEAAVRPGATSLTEREKAKAAELTAAGRPVTGQHGQAPPPAVGGARPGRPGRPAGRPADAARRAGLTTGSSTAMRQAIGEAAEASSRTPGSSSGGRGRSSPRPAMTAPCRRTGRSTGCSARCRTAGT